MKSIRVQARVNIDLDEVIDVEDDLKGPALSKHIFWVCREIAKDYIYDAPIKVDSICLEDTDDEIDLD